MKLEEYTESVIKIEIEPSKETKEYILETVKGTLDEYLTITKWSVESFVLEKMKLKVEFKYPLIISQG